MTTGRHNKLVGQTGEYLVAAELSRRGLIATTFTGNVPHYDIIASNELGKHISVQVKAAWSKGGKTVSWQFNIRTFCDVTFKGKKQVFGKACPVPVLNLMVVLVRCDESGQDSFYVCRWEELRDVILKSHLAFMKSHNWIRPKNPASTHTAIKEADIVGFRDRWDKIEQGLR
jgi:hypothetical protein